MKLAFILLAGICLSTPLLVGACGNFVALEKASDAGPVDAMPTIDAMPGAADAMPGAADAMPGVPDAMPGAADAMPRAADAMPGTPDAA